MEKARILMEALPFIKEYYGHTVVIKFGGNAMIDEELKESFASDIVLMRYVGINPIIVHGGGPADHRVHGPPLPRRQVHQRPPRHRRPTMEVVKMVLVGKVNKEIVSLINGHGDLLGRPLGRGRAHAHHSQEAAGRRRTWASSERWRSAQPADPPQPGPRRLHPGGGQHRGGRDRDQSYNVNADHVAGALAVALEADKLIYLTDVNGIYRDLADPASLISEMDLARGEGPDGQAAPSPAG